MPIHGYAALNPGGALEPFSWEPAPLGEDEVEVRVERSAICHSDLSMIRNEWGISHYPLVPGHEVIGTIEAIGSGVSGVRPGGRVGIGWQSRSCGHCEHCRRGDEVFCGVDGQRTIVHGHGGFAEAIRVQHRFAIPVPAALDSDSAAPLMCAGITVFASFVDFDVRPGMRVGVIGVGGLGHLALQFARAWGCEVSALSSSTGKSDEARSLGAHHVLDTNDPAALDEAAGRFDFLLNTVSGDIDWARCVAALRPRGTLVTVGVPNSPIAIPASLLMGAQRRLAGSPVGSPDMIRRMLDFAATFRVAPVIERFALAEINEALAKMAANRMRYRAVLAVPG